MTRVHLVFRQHQVAHEDFHPVRTLRERHPPSEAERGWCVPLADGHAQIGARDVHLQYAVFEVAGFPEGRQGDLVLAGHLLGWDAHVR
jgi:hypothetical protein